jgi:hypothetical protein
MGSICAIYSRHHRPHYVKSRASGICRTLFGLVLFVQTSPIMSSTPPGHQNGVVAIESTRCLFSKLLYSASLGHSLEKACRCSLSLRKGIETSSGRSTLGGKYGIPNRESPTSWGPWKDRVWWGPKIRQYHFPPPALVTSWPSVQPNSLQPRLHELHHSDLARTAVSKWHQYTCVDFATPHAETLSSTLEMPEQIWSNSEIERRRSRLLRKLIRPNKMVSQRSQIQQRGNSPTNSSTFVGWLWFSRS